MGIAALAICPAPAQDESWLLPRLHTAWNTTEDTADWIKTHIPATAAQVPGRYAS